MTTINTTLKARRALPSWSFPLLWLVATFLGGMLYVFPVMAVHIALGLDHLSDPPRPGEIGLGMIVIAAVLCGAACGSTIGLAQWLILRTRIKDVGLWVAATIAGYGSIGLLARLVSVWYPDWLDWALTLIIDGKLHWLARLEADWPAASWLPGAISLTLLGATLGIAQWPVLRGRVPQAGWWIAISTAGWALAAGLCVVPSRVGVVFVSYFLPPIVAGIGLLWLMSRPAPAGRSTTA